jgi:hypothetical protein
MKWYGTKNADVAEKSSIHAKTWTSLRSEQGSRNEKDREAAHYTPSNENGKDCTAYLA